MTTTVRNPKLDSARPLASDPAVDGVSFDGTSDVILATYSRGIYIDTAGNLTVDMIGMNGAVGATLTFSNLLAGVVYPFAVSKIYDAGTTASGVALY